MAKTIIYLVRHCEFENPKNVFPFRLPGYPLSTKGKKRAKSLAEHFKKKKIGSIYSSPILRTKQTAEIIASGLELKVLTDDLLKETKTPLQGIKKEKLRKMQESDGFFCLEEHIKEGGESIEEINRRMKKFVNKIQEKHFSEKIIAVSHGDPIMIYKKILIGGEVKGLWQSEDYIPKGGIFKLVFDEKRRFESYSRVNY